MLFLLHSLYIQFKNFSQNRFVLRYKALAVRHLDIEKGTSLLELEKNIDRLDQSIDNKRMDSLTKKNCCSIWCGNVSRLRTQELNESWLREGDKVDASLKENKEEIKDNRKKRIVDCCALNAAATR